MNVIKYIYKNINIYDLFKNSKYISATAYLRLHISMRFKIKILKMLSNKYTQ